MVKYIIKRLLNLIPVFLIISMLLFGLMHAMPADPVELMMPQDPNLRKNKELYLKTKEQIKERFGFNKSIPEQYVSWLGRMVSGEFGESTSFNKPVKEIIGRPLMNTVKLNIFSTIISLVLAITIGIKSAVRAGGFYDKLWQVLSLIGISMPTFFIGIGLIFIFAFTLKWLPPTATSIETDLWSQIKHLILPMITITLGSLAGTIRYVRNSMMDALSQDYIRTARAKGVKEKTVIYSHAFRNALIPVVTVVVWAIIGIFGGAPITEQVFAYNGIGNYLLNAVLAKDFNLVLTLNMFFAVLSLLGNLFMDLGYALVDPRVRLE
ncbi:ABC transporter permease [Peptoniphilaceae bacterium SGI.131]